jgi:hypothetical protein
MFGLISEMKWTPRLLALFLCWSCRPLLVEMPWQFWQPEENDDPIAKAVTDGLNPRVEAAMKMAQRLD